MARNFTLQWDGGKVDRPSASFAQQDQVPTTLRPCDAFSPSADESVILEGTLPAEYTGSGTLKLDILACANTTTAADDARLDAVTEFRTQGADEPLNADNFDGTADSGTMTFSTTAYSLQRLTITLTPGTTPAAGDRFRIKLTRDADNAGGLDDLAADLLAVGYELYEET